MKSAYERVLNLTSLVLIILMFIGLTIIAFLSFYPFKVIDFNYYTLPVVNDDNTVVAGENLFYKISYCKYRDLPSETIKTLRNGFIYHLESTTTSAPIGCFDNVVSKVLIPIETPPGKYYMSFSVNYNVNPFQARSITVNTDYFIILSSS